MTRVRAGRKFLKSLCVPKINDGAFSHVMDFKSQLQEYVRRDGKGSLEYKISNEKVLRTIVNSKPSYL